MSFTVRRVKVEKNPSALKKYVHILRPTMRWFSALSGHFQHTKHVEEVQKREKTLKRMMIILISIFIVLLLLIGTLKVMLRVKELAMGVAALAGAELPKDEHGFTNVLLLGEGNSDHSGVDLTDTMMVASLDPEKTKSAVLISIPRDTYVLSTEKMGNGRINSLYRDYKTAMIRKGMKESEASLESLRQLNIEVGSLIGLPIHGVIKINFSGFTEAVDFIGGIDITVPEDLVDREYPGSNYSYETFSISQGEKHLDGATALKYARSRHSTSDFSRSERQQKIISAILKNVKEQGLIKNVSRITEILSILAKNTQSTFSSRELLSLAAMGKVIDQNQIVSVQINNQNGLFGSSIGQGGFLYAPPRDQFDGAAVLLPVSIPAFPITWKQIKSFIVGITQERMLFIHPVRLIVLNAGSKEGSARKIGGELYRYHFNVENTRNFATGKNPSFVESFMIINPNLENDPEKVALLSQAKATAAFLGNLFGMTVKEDPEGNAFGEDDADLAIVLGQDFQYTPLQERL